MSLRWQLLTVAALLLISGTIIWVLASSSPTPGPEPDSGQQSSLTPAAVASQKPSSPRGTGDTQPRSPEAAGNPQPEQPPPSPEEASRQSSPPGEDKPAGEATQPAKRLPLLAPPSRANDPLALYPGEDEPPADEEQTYEDIWARPIPVPPEAKGLKRLTKHNGVWIDPQRKRIVIAGRVVCRRGALEMFACPKQTKEHESVVAVNTKAFVVHAALLALGVEPGRPVQFAPDYRPAQGPEIRVLVCWTDPQGKRRCVPAQKWIRNVRTGREMQQPWLFTGSQWWESPDGKQRYYMAEQGDFICVSNFPTAMMDLPIRSSNAASALLFAAFTERIPPLGTDVALILEPVKKSAAKPRSGSDKSSKTPPAPKS